MARGPLGRARLRVYDSAFSAAVRHPPVHNLLRRVNRLLRARPPVRFEGWGMTTTHEPPWTTGADDEVFRESLRLASALEFTGEAGITSGSVDSLAWRHWTVAFATRLAATSVDPGPFAGIECGVADGTTAFFALRELQNRRSEHEFHLYDSWDEIPADSVSASEKFQAGRYGGLSRNLTERNLAQFSSRVVWHEGLLPASLARQPLPPERVGYIHIDLNVAEPTRLVCEQMWPRLERGGVILFDDYGWLGFKDTKRVVDEFVDGTTGAVLLKMPTAQALLLKVR